MSEAKAWYEEERDEFEIESSFWVKLRFKRTSETLCNAGLLKIGLLEVFEDSEPERPHYQFTVIGPVLHRGSL